MLARIGALTCVDRLITGDGDDALQRELSDLDGMEQLLDEVQPEVIVNAAAYTAVDKAESEPETVFRINSELPDRLASWCKRRDAMLMHYSTDYVFSGDASQAYRETDPTGPLSVYGDSKLSGERAIAGHGCRHVVLRTSWVYSSHGSNFVLTMLRLARERPALGIVADQIGCPTWARNLAAVTVQVLTRMDSGSDDIRKRGTWHYCDSGIVSWYDFAGAIFDAALALGLLERVPELSALTSDKYPQAAARPMYSVLDTAAIMRDFGIQPAGLKDSLEACLKELKEHDDA